MDSTWKEPVPGNNAQGRQVHGVTSLHVEDFLMAGDDAFEKQIMVKIRTSFQVGPGFIIPQLGDVDFEKSGFKVYAIHGAICGYYLAL